MRLIQHRKLLHKPVLLILFVTFLWLVADRLLEFVFPTYLEGLNKSYSEIGILLSLASVSGILVDLIMGELSDRASRKKLMIYGLCLSIIASILIFCFKSNIILAGIFLLWGFSYQFWKVPRDAHFASVTDKKHRAECYGINNEVNDLGETIGPILGGVILLYLGFTGTITVYSILLIAAIFVLFKYMKETNHRKLRKAIPISMKMSSILKSAKEMRILGLSGIILLYYALLFSAWGQILYTLEPLFYSRDVLNLQPHLGGILLGLFSLPGIFISHITGKFADRLGKKIMLFAGLMAIGIFIILFAITKSTALIFALALAIGIGWAVAAPALNGLIVDIAYKQKKGEISGMWNFFMDIGYIGGPAIGGVIADIYGLRHTFLIMGMIFLISSMLLIFIKTQAADGKNMNVPSKV